jgi:hypothetical protein
MTWESGSTDQQRLRAGYAVLTVGLFILLFAWGMAVMRGPQAEGEVAVRHEKLEPPTPDRVLPAVGLGMVVCGLCLIVVLLISVFAFIRISRRYRDHLLHAPPTPTPTADVWRMHRVPEVADGAEEDRDA